MKSYHIHKDLRFDQLNLISIPLIDCLHLLSYLMAAKFIVYCISHPAVKILISYLKHRKQHVNDEHVTQYKACLNDKLNNIELPNDVLLCKDVLCDNANHRILLDKLCKRSHNDMC